MAPPAWDSAPPNVVAEGATVYLLGRRQSELDAAVARLGPAAVAAPADVTVNGDLDRLYATLAERLSTTVKWARQALRCAWFRIGAGRTGRSSAGANSSCPGRLLARRPADEGG